MSPNRKLSQKSKSTPSPQDPISSETLFQQQIQGLISQKKYRQALEEIKKTRKTQPDMNLNSLEAEVWLLQGQQEFQKQDFKQAESSLRRSLDLGLTGITHYEISRCLLALDRLDTALELIKTAFEAKTLPKEYAICYLKLLFLKGDTATVEQLITQQSKQFSAPQIHWAKGVLDLKADHPVTATEWFQKIKRPLTPTDLTSTAVAYAQQRAKDWSGASITLGIQEPSPNMLYRLSWSEPAYLKHPFLKRLAFVQKAETGDITASELKQADPAIQEALTAMIVVNFLERDDAHNAAHAILTLKARPTLPELATLRPLILTEGGQQALMGGEPECSEAFWTPLLEEKPFNPQLAVNLLNALEENNEGQAQQHLATRLIKWVEQERKQNPQNWAGDRLPLTLAHLHCRVADAWIGCDKYAAAQGALRQAERICPTSPEVMGRKGLDAFTEGKFTEAVQLLTQALAGGCVFAEVYGVLLACFDRLKDSSSKLEARRRFGQKFGDLNPEAEVVFEGWQAALQTQKYSFFQRLIKSEKDPDAPMQACKIFVEAVQSPPGSSGTVSLNQAQAQVAWDSLLSSLSGAVLIESLQAIALSIQLFAKKEKGIAAMGDRYRGQLIELTRQYPEAHLANLTLLILKSSNHQKLEIPLRAYLNAQPQPANALALLQLKVRRYKPNKALLPFIEETLNREPQNSLLLLAKATTYPPHGREYERLKDQGFDLARRLQDAQALQAFREEQAFLDEQQAHAFLPDPDLYEALDDDAKMAQTDALLESMIRSMMGSKMSKAELERAMPEIKQMLLNSLPPNMMDAMDGDDDFEEGDFFNFFGNGKKRKRDFRSL
jgi:hypothetical protein